MNTNAPLRPGLDIEGGETTSWGGDPGGLAHAEAVRRRHSFLLLKENEQPEPHQTKLLVLTSDHQQSALLSFTWLKLKLTVHHFLGLFVGYRGTTGVRAEPRVDE